MIAMKSTPFCFTSVECFAKVKAEIAMTQLFGTCPLSYESSVVMKMMNICFTYFSWVLRKWTAGVWCHILFFLLRFSISLFKICMYRPRDVAHF